MAFTSRMRRLLAVSLAAVLLASCGESGSPAARSEPEVEELDRAIDEALESQDEAFSEAAYDALVATALEYGLGPEALEEYASDIALAIEDLSAYWTDVLPELYGVEHVPPENIFPYSGEIDPPECGGQVLEPGNAFYCFEDDFIAWDDTGLMFPYFAEIGDFAIAFIIAHEWGHKIQEQVDAQGEFGIQYELQADCYAGAWAWDADDRGLVEPGDIDESLAALVDAADLRGTPWTDPAAHGKPRERVGAFLIGYDEGPLSCTEFTF